MPDFEFDDLEDYDQGETKETNPVKELRLQARRLNKELKERDAELESLRTFKAQYDQEQKANAASKVFSDLGLPEAQAKIFVRLNPEVEATPDAVRAYASEYGLAVADEETPADEGEPIAPFRPVSVAGSNPSRGGSLKYDEYQTLLRENPQAALQAVAEGRVEGMLRSDGPPG